MDKYKTVNDILQDLDTKILLKESYIYKLKVVKLNLANFLFSLFIIIYYYGSVETIIASNILPSIIEQTTIKIC